MKDVRGVTKHVLHEKHLGNFHDARRKTLCIKKTPADRKVSRLFDKFGQTRGGNAKATKRRVSLFWIFFTFSEYSVVASVSLVSLVVVAGLCGIHDSSTKNELSHVAAATEMSCRKRAGNKQMGD